jgi:hypothetical protein
VPQLAQYVSTSGDRRPVARRRAIALAALLGTLTLAVYWQVGRFGFLVFDDPAYVPENRHVLAGLTVDSVRWAFATIYDANWIP